MRLLQSTPQNREFYNEHGRSLRTFATIANLGQLLSALSLSLALFTLLSSAVAGRGLTLSTTVVAAAAVAVAVFVELANRSLARPAIKPFVVPNQFAEDPERKQRHRTLTLFSRGGLLLVGGLSFVLSYQGSITAGELLTDAPPPPAIDSIAGAFTADTTALLAPYAQQAVAAKNEFTATAAERAKAASRFNSCARNGNKWCKGQQQRLAAEVDAAAVTLNAKLATIASERGHQLTRAVAKRDAAIQEAKDENQALVATAQADAATTGYLFAVLTATGQVVFYLMYYLILQVTAGSEILERLEPNEFSAQPSVWSDLKAVVDHRTERGARRLIAWAFGQRDRLDKPLPYVDLWGQPSTSDDQTAHLRRRIGFSQADQREQSGAKQDESFIAHQPDTNTNTNTNTEQPAAGYLTPEARELKQRIKFYKKRLGQHKQKAIVQCRTTGEVKSRTAAAINNNQQWVDHYTEQLNSLQNGK